jgi:hypothetical protein
MGAPRAAALRSSSLLKFISTAISLASRIAFSASISLA